MGNSDSRSLDFWTTEEYQQFIQTIEPGTRYYLIFEILFWTGCRIGELLALTPADINFERNQISITKTYYRTERQDVITEPKTKQSVRLIEIPEFLKQEIKDFIDSHYEMPENERLFPIVQEAVQHKMKHQMEKAGVKKIRVHDLRHPYVKPKTKKYESFYVPSGSEKLPVQLNNLSFKACLLSYSSRYEKVLCNIFYLNPVFRKDIHFLNQ